MEHAVADTLIGYDGEPPVTVNAGGVLFIPAGTVHAAKNVGNINAAELGTYVVEKGKPLVTLAERPPTSLIFHREP